LLLRASCNLVNIGDEEADKDEKEENLKD